MHQCPKGPKRKTHQPQSLKLSGASFLQRVQIQYLCMFWGNLRHSKTAAFPFLPHSTSSPGARYTKERIHWSPVDVEPEACGSFTIPCSIHFMRVDPVFLVTSRPNPIGSMGLVYLPTLRIIGPYYGGILTLHSRVLLDLQTTSDLRSHDF